MAGNKTEQGHYGRVWDEYVTEDFPRIQAGTPHSKRELEPWRVLNKKDDRYDWPGDEWGSKADAEAELFTALTLESPRVVCELGAGSGRYTQLIFERFPDIGVISFDVSREFERCLRGRFAEKVRAGQLETELLGADPLQVVAALKKRDLIGKVDAFISFDAMVHVELHTLFMYWFSAAKSLRPGGQVVMNVADATSERGFMKLAFNAPGVYRGQGGVGGHFMWLSPEIVETVLKRLGFAVQLLPGNGRDCSFRATLEDAEHARDLFNRAGVNYFDSV